MVFCAGARDSKKKFASRGEKNSRRRDIILERPQEWLLGAGVVAREDADGPGGGTLARLNDSKDSLRSVVNVCDGVPPYRKAKTAVIEISGKLSKTPTATLHRTSHTGHEIKYTESLRR